MEFQRARSDTQREQRRHAILAAASAMLDEMPVADLSLNELSRRVGLAKSNVLRYFESREAVLLELLNAGLQEWGDALDLSAVSLDAPPLDRIDAVAKAIATSLAARPVLCDLVSAQAAVLERNVSTETILRHKRGVNLTVQLLSGILNDCLPELDGNDIYHAIALTLLLTAGVWPHDHPTEALLAAYSADPEVGARRMDFVTFLEQTLALTITGCLMRKVPARQVVSQKKGLPVR
ncbi:TetR/AcrR family transcriptional regulator [Sphingomonas abaci]|uniref:AcrR family transcriptional regulator n=1 Tax=Sphingomonas abaci TaxID=237611 RepID=A0A7W7AM73_9SPHN|nr:TetR family transcriptional regulator [Sphingomonas abaci]MBB4619648.1 AcrR family transcriptional regulator [Sphingomonas abaci]